MQILNYVESIVFQREIPVRGRVVGERPASLVRRDSENTSWAESLTVITSRQTPSCCSRGASQLPSWVLKWKILRRLLRDSGLINGPGGPEKRRVSQSKGRICCQGTARTYRGEVAAIIKFWWDLCWERRTPLHQEVSKKQWFKIFTH